MRNKILRSVLVLTVAIFGQTSVFAQSGLLGVLNLGQGTNALSSLPLLGGGAGVGALPINNVLGAVTPLLSVVPVDQLLVPVGPILGFVVTDLRVDSLVAGGIPQVTNLVDVLLPGPANIDTLWATILRLD